MEQADTRFPVRQAIDRPDLSHHPQTQKQAADLRPPMSLNRLCVRRESAMLKIIQKFEIHPDATCNTSES